MSTSRQLTVVVIHPAFRRAQQDAQELERGGLRAFFATDLAGARALIDNHHPDAIVCEARLALEANAPLGAPVVVTAMRLTADDYETLQRNCGVTALVTGFDPPGALKTAVTNAARGKETASRQIAKRVVFPPKPPADRKRWRSFLFELSRMGQRPRPTAEQRALAELIDAVSIVGANGLLAWLESPAGAHAPALLPVLKRCGLSKAHTALSRVLRLFPGRWPRDDDRRAKLAEALRESHRALFDAAQKQLNAILDSGAGLDALRRWAARRWKPLTRGEPPWEQLPLE